MFEGQTVLQVLNLFQWWIERGGEGEGTGTRPHTDQISCSFREKFAKSLVGVLLRKSLMRHSFPLHSKYDLYHTISPQGQYIHKTFLFYRPQRSCEGYVLQASVCPQGGVCLSACWDTPPGADTPLGVDTPQHTPPGADTHTLEQTSPGSRHPPPRRDGHCCGGYASYWNAFLLVWELPSD